ncbi:carboxymuconolactone decarboxylase family protein [Bradyrhizobium sp. USDA 3650]
MTTRTSAFVAAPQLVQQLMDYGRTLLDNGLEQDFVRLVAIRTSQINGSAAGLQLYYSEARKEGPLEPRLDLVIAWRDTDLFTARERAALGWAEALTRVAEALVSDEAYDLCLSLESGSSIRSTYPEVSSSRSLSTTHSAPSIT